MPCFVVIHRLIPYPESHVLLMLLRDGMVGLGESSRIQRPLPAIRLGAPFLRLSAAIRLLRSRGLHEQLQYL